MKKCSKCGREYANNFTYCPACGGELDENNQESYTYSIDDGGQATVDVKKETHKGHIILIVILLVIAAILGGLYIATPKSIDINNGETLEMYIGESANLDVYAKGFNKSDYENIVWTSEDNGLISISKDGKLTAGYDKTAFNSNSIDSYTTTVNATLKKGILTYEGYVDVKASLKSVKLKNGKIYKNPSDSKSTYLKVTAPDNSNVYIYMENQSNSSNDAAFTLKKGKSAKINVPVGTYTLYCAYGDTWYGSKYLFGPTTYYVKDSKSMKFTSGSYWTLKLGVSDGNSKSENIDSSEFPN